MKNKHIAIVVLIALSAFPCFAQSNQDSANSFEELPELKASEIFQGDLLKGQHYTVREAVPTFSGANQFTIDSDFGVFEADGNEMLLRRINEINAIARLKEVSRTDQYKEALLKAAASPLVSAKNIVTDPVNTVTNVPKGIFKFIGRKAENVRNIGKQEGKDPEGGKIQQVIGYSDAKRKLAVKLGVDPYSTNATLQKELNGIAWASFAGGLTFQAATFPISGPAGAALTVTGTASNLDKLVEDKSPTDLQIMNRKMLEAMSVDGKDIDRFLNNNAFSPTQETAFVLNLKALDGVANRGAFVRAAAETSSEESDVIFCVQTAALLGKIHRSEKPLARLAMIKSFPVGIAKDGSVVVALQWDYAAWTAGAAAFTGEVQKMAAQNKSKGGLVELSGQTSPRLHQELEAQGFTVRDRASGIALK